MPDDLGPDLYAEFNICEPHVPRRGDEVEAWLKEWMRAIRKYAHHDDIARGHAMVLELVNDYRRHADAGVPLSEDIPTGSA